MSSWLFLIPSMSIKYIWAITQYLPSRYAPRLAQTMCTHDADHTPNHWCTGPELCVDWALRVYQNRRAGSPGHRLRCQGRIHRRGHFKGPQQEGQFSQTWGERRYHEATRIYVVEIAVYTQQPITERIAVQNVNNGVPTILDSSSSVPVTYLAKRMV